MCGLVNYYFSEGPELEIKCCTYDYLVVECGNDVNVRSKDEIATIRDRGHLYSVISCH
jgi:hypothetical protein